MTACIRGNLKFQTNYTNNRRFSKPFRGRTIKKDSSFQDKVKIYFYSKVYSKLPFCSKVYTDTPDILAKGVFFEGDFFISSRDNINGSLNFQKIKFFSDKEFFTSDELSYKSLSYGEEYYQTYVEALKLDEEIKICPKTALKIKKLTLEQNKLESLKPQDSEKMDVINNQLSHEFRKFF